MSNVCHASGLGSQISAVNAQVAVVQRQVSEVSHGVRDVGNLANSTASRLEELWGLFVDFIHRDKRDKALQLAETRLVKIRQEIEHLYGIRDLARRRMIGLLQANDLQLVRKETSLLIAEHTFVDAPRYWLAPALIGFSAWLANDEVRCNEAFGEMLKRDPEKGKLFLALLFFRTGRDENAHTWVEEYLSQQQPEALSRASIALIDAASNGLLPQTSCQAVLNKLSGWLDLMKLQDNFDIEQTKTWTELLSALKPDLSEQEFPALRHVSINWPQWQVALEWSHVQPEINKQIRSLFSASSKVDPEVKERIDSLLEFLINDFEEDESSLRIDEMLNSAIVELEGERESAMERINAYRLARSERLSVGELLAVATSNNEANHSSLATRKLATLMSRSWIAKAIEELQIIRKNHTPKSINISVNGFSAEISTTHNESDITSALNAHYNQLEAAEIKRRRWTPSGIGLIAVSIGAMFFGLVGFVVGLCLFLWGVYLITSIAKTVKAEFEKLRGSALATVSQAFKECSQIFQRIQNMDAMADDNVNLLNTLDAAVLKAESNTIIEPVRLQCLEAIPLWSPQLAI